MSIAMKIAKWFIPNEKKLAKMAAEKIQQTVNQCEKEAQIASAAQMVRDSQEWQGFVSALLVDGKIDDVETDEIAEKIRPLIKKIMEMI